jgi:hypothetical protein
MACETTGLNHVSMITSGPPAGGSKMCVIWSPAYERSGSGNSAVTGDPTLKERPRPTLGPPSPERPSR